jgi:hypothetical protein
MYEQQLKSSPGSSFGWWRINFGETGFIPSLIWVR